MFNGAFDSPCILEGSVQSHFWMVVMRIITQTVNFVIFPYDNITTRDLSL